MIKFLLPKILSKDLCEVNGGHYDDLLKIEHELIRYDIT